MNIYILIFNLLFIIKIILAAEEQVNECKYDNKRIKEYIDYFYHNNCCKGDKKYCEILEYFLNEECSYKEEMINEMIYLMNEEPNYENYDNYKENYQNYDFSKDYEECIEIKHRILDELRELENESQSKETIISLPTPPKTKNSKIGLIIGSCSGFIIILLLVFAFYRIIAYYRKTNKNKNSKTNKNKNSINYVSPKEYTPEDKNFLNTLDNNDVPSIKIENDITEIESKKSSFNDIPIATNINSSYPVLLPSDDKDNPEDDKIIDSINDKDIINEKISMIDIKKLENEIDIEKKSFTFDNVDKINMKDDDNLDTTTDINKINTPNENNIININDDNDISSIEINSSELLQPPPPPLQKLLSQPLKEQQEPQQEPQQEQMKLMKQLLLQQQQQIQQMQQMQQLLLQQLQKSSSSHESEQNSFPSPLPPLPLPISIENNPSSKITTTITDTTNTAATHNNISLSTSNQKNKMNESTTTTTTSTTTITHEDSTQDYDEPPPNYEEVINTTKHS